jgi:acyl-CoA synthetase (AMP-forming)/AMP-acid ligase II
MVKNIAETLNQVAALHGDRTGLIEAKTGRRMSFSQLNSLSDGYAAYLGRQGVRAHDRVMLMVTPSADFICLTFALFKMGVTIILIDPGMGYRNLLRCIEGVQPTVFIGIPKARLFAALFPRPFQSVKLKFCCGNSFGLFGADIRGRISAEGPSYPVYSPGSDDLAAIIFTTGSTGPPKGVRYEHSIFAAQLARVRDYYGIDSTHVDQPAFPLFALFSASLGACSVIPDMDPSRPALVDPEKFISSINRYGVTYSFGSPAIWNVVSRYCGARSITLQSLKKVLMAGAPVPGELLERVRAILPPDAEIFTPYGATESLPIVSMESREILQETWQESSKGKGVCVGRPLPGIDLRVITIQDRPVPVYDRTLELPLGEIGEIIVRGDVVTKGYENNAAETESAKIQDGGRQSFWHRMGDTGYLDGKGRLWFCGRKAHRVITAKGTLFTIPCEAIVNEHRDVYRSALVGIPEGDGPFCRPVLIVEPVKGYRGSERRLIEEVSRLAAESPVTEEISTFLVHKNFPVDIRHNAKIFREKLAVWAAEKLRSLQ